MSLQLVFKHIKYSLDTLASIELHQTLQVVGNQLVLDDRHLQTLRRSLPAFTNDNRNHILTAIERNFGELYEVIISYRMNIYMQHNGQQLVIYAEEQIDIIEDILNNLKTLIDDRDKVLSGLQKLAQYERYKGDIHFSTQIKELSEQYTRIVNQASELKKSKLEKYQPRTMAIKNDVVAIENIDEEKS